MYYHKAMPVPLFRSSTQYDSMNDEVLEWQYDKIIKIYIIQTNKVPVQSNNLDISGYKAVGIFQDDGKTWFQIGDRLGDNYYIDEIVYFKNQIILYLTQKCESKNE